MSMEMERRRRKKWNLFSTMKASRIEMDMKGEMDTERRTKGKPIVNMRGRMKVSDSCKTMYIHTHIHESTFI